MTHYRRIVLLVFVTIGCTSNDRPIIEEDVLAQINNHRVSVIHFQNAFKENYYRTGQVLTPTESTRKAILDSEFNTYVMAVYARDLELDKTPEALNQKSAIRKRILTEEYFKQIILADLEVTTSDLRDYFIRYNSNLRASHLYARTRKQADSLYKRIQQGEIFEDLAKEVFINPYLAQNGGDIGRFTTDELDIAFEDKVFSMNVGEISEPIQTAQGFSIIKLTDRVVRPLLTEHEFNQSNGRLQAYARKKKGEAAKRYHLENFNNEVRIDSLIFEELYTIILSDVKGFLNKEPEFLSQLDLNANILNYESFYFSTHDFESELLSSSVAMLNTIQDKFSFRNFMVGVAYRAFMVSEAEKLGINKQLEVQASISETYQHYLEELVMQKLASSITNTPAELYTLYRQKKNDFYQSAEIRVQRLAVFGEKKANKLYSELLAGADFTNYVIEHTRINDDLFTEGDLGFIPVEDFGFNAERLSRIKIGGLTQPLLYTADEYHIYKILDKKEAHVLTFEEARERLDQFLLREKLQLKRAATIELVKNKHDAVIDLEKLNALTIKI